MTSTSHDLILRETDADVVRSEMFNKALEGGNLTGTRSSRHGAVGNLSEG